MTAEQFRPSFTTSQEAQEDKREERNERLGKNFHERVTVKHGTQKPTNVPKKRK